VTTKKTTPKRKAPSEPQAPFPDIDHLARPPSDSPEAQAQYFMQLLDAFAQHGTTESKRLRSALIEAVSAYTEEAKGDLGRARQVFIGKLAGIETSVVELSMKSVKKMRERVIQDGRSTGTKSQTGKDMKSFADGLGFMAEAMQLMLDAAKAGDLEARERASSLMDQASKLLTAIARA
jgi:hypothetical protein